MRWLLGKDLRILWRSPALVAALVIYPAVVALLIGLSLSRDPAMPRVAVLNQVAPGAQTLRLGSQSVDAARYAQQLFAAIDPVKVASRAQARRLVRDGKVVAAIVIPADVTRQLEAAVNLGGGAQPKIEVIYNGRDPIKSRYVESLITSRVAAANRALSRQLTKVAGGYLDILLHGGDFAVLGQDFKVLGLERSRDIVDSSLTKLPPSSSARSDLQDVARFAQLAIDNLDLSGQLLSTVSEPLRIERSVIDGRHTTLETFAVAVAAIVSLMLVTLFLAAGLLALERQDHTFRRLLRGLVGPSTLLGEKALLAGACGVVVATLLLAGVGLFVPLEWGRLPLWVLALTAGGAGFGALGVALGSVVRDVQAASLLAFALALPLAFLAVVPSSAISATLFDVLSAVSALFPFKPALDALDRALGAGGSMAIPVAHLALLAALYGVVARLALRRI